MKVAIVQMYGTDLKADLVEQMMKAADTNKDGEVDLGEFKAIMRAGPNQGSGKFMLWLGDVWMEFDTMVHTRTALLSTSTTLFDREPASVMPTVS